MVDTKSSRILYIGPIPPEYGGIKSGGVATYFWELTNYAHQAGYDVHLLTHLTKRCADYPFDIISWPKDNFLLKTLKALLQATRPTNSNIFLRYFGLKQKLVILYKRQVMKKLIDDLKPDIIHVAQIFDPVVFSILSLHSRPPLVVTDHGVGMVLEGNLIEEYQLPPNPELWGALIKAVDRIVCVSRFAKEALLHHTNSFAYEQKMFAILNPINEEKIKFYDKLNAKKKLNLPNLRTILFVGVHLPFEKKGLGVLLKAFAEDECLKKNTTLLIVADPGTCIRIQRIIKGDLVNIHTIQAPAQNLDDCYNASDVFVMPSKLEGIGLAYYEALLSGVPIIGYHKSVEELQSALNLYIGEKYNSEFEGAVELAEKIKKVLDMEINREALRKAVIEHLSWKVKFREYGELYDSLLT